SFCLYKRFQGQVANRTLNALIIWVNCVDR
ncbi:MAG: hypothetical protein ACI936_003206, partial [Paraglaciecola sp.]